MTPRDLEQRAGRILRQGNSNETVRIKRYVTVGTFDAYLWQIIENKQKYISQIMSGNSVSRRLDDKDTATLTYAEIKAIATGNPLIQKKMELENEIARLKILEKQYTANIYELETKIVKTYPRTISYAQKELKSLENDINVRNANSTSEFSIKIKDKILGEKSKENAGVFLKEIANSKFAGQEIGEYRGFKIIPQKDTFSDPVVILKREMETTVKLGESGHGNIQRIDNALDKLEERHEETQELLNRTSSQLISAKKEVQHPFLQADELLSAEEELKDIDTQLDLDKDDNSVYITETNNFQEVETIIEDIE